MLKKLIAISIGVLVLLLFLSGSCSIVKPGYRGVRITMGAVSPQALDEGIHLKFPLTQRIVSVEVRVSQAEFKGLAAASASMQDVFSDVNVSFHIMPEKVPNYYKRYGKDPTTVINLMLSAKLQEIVKSTTNMYSTEELLRQRLAIRDTIYNRLNKVAIKQDIIIDEFSMTNFRFSTSYQLAIEEKQVMEQRAETARRAKEVATQEGEAKIISARAEAESNKLRQVSITPQLIRYEEIMVLKSKWDGKLPQVTGGAIPLLNLGQ